MHALSGRLRSALARSALASSALGRSALGRSALACSALALAAVLGAASVAQARCGDADAPRWLGHQSLIALVNPLGAEHNARFGLCLPLYESADPVLALNHFEAGVSTYLSPVYFVPGAYAQIVPVSFFVLRVEVHGLTVWPIPIAGAGYYARSGYDQSWSQDQVPASDGGSANGFSMRIMGVLRFQVPLTESLSILALAATWTETNILDRGQYWLDVRDDMVAASGDWVIDQEAVLLLQARWPEGFGLRFGAFSALRTLPSAGYVGHQLGPIAMMSFGRVDPHVYGLGFFLRMGIYTSHRFRTGTPSAMLGVNVDWDLGGL